MRTILWIVVFPQDWIARLVGGDIPIHYVLVFLNGVSHTKPTY